MEHQDEHDSGAEGLGTSTGANEPGGQNPDHTPGATPEGEMDQTGDAPDNPVGSDNPESDDSTTHEGVPQEGEVDEDADAARDATDPGEEPPDSVS